MKKILISVMLLIAIILTPITSQGSTLSDAFTYDVSINTSAGGQVYWNYGKNLEFFLGNNSTATKGEYNENCLARNATNYNFSYALTRGLIVKPLEGYYFDGFYDRLGNRLSLDSIYMDVIRITKDGLYYYDYVQSMSNPKFNNYTEKKYKDYVSAYTKGIYNVSRYKKLFQIELFNLPKQDADIYPKFLPKTSQDLGLTSTINKTYGDSSFYISPKISTTSQLKYKSSNSRVLKVDKVTGLATIIGEGKATITVSTSETAINLPSQETITVLVKPTSISLTSATDKSVKSKTGKVKKSVIVKWTKDPKCTGYEIQISTTKDFYSRSTKRSTAPSKSTSKEIKGLKDTNYKYAKVRAYKTSCKTKIFGPWSTIKSIS